MFQQQLWKNITIPNPFYTYTRKGYFQAQVADKTMKAHRGKDGEKKSTVILGVMQHCNRATHGRSSKI